MQMIDLEAVQAATVTTDPYPYFIVPRFVRPEAIGLIEADYPEITIPGSVPLPSLKYGSAFDQFMQELRGKEMASLMSEKLNIDLSSRPTTITVRGQCRVSDGQIHTDSTSKLVTVLIYMNGRWEEQGGRLRLLRSHTNLNDYFAEVPPEQGTLLAFRNQSNAWHGHQPFAGQRRVIQLNWVENQWVVESEHIRHRLSAFVKSCFASFRRL